MNIKLVICTIGLTGLGAFFMASALSGAGAENSTTHFRTDNRQNSKHFYNQSQEPDTTGSEYGTSVHTISQTELIYERRPQIEASSIDIDSVTMLISHLDETSADLIDFDSVVNIIDDSHSAFDYVAREYLFGDDPRKRRVLYNALNNSSNPARAGFALELAHSTNLDQRRKAYAWLSSSKQTFRDDRIYDTLLDATYHEHDRETLSQLVSSMPLAEFSDTPELRERAILRLNELAFHPDDTVSSKAIAKLSESAINYQTLSILRMHLQDGSETRQLAALEGLKNFDDPGGDVMTSLNAILHNPDLPRQNRATAARVLIDFENQLNSSKSL